MKFAVASWPSTPKTKESKQAALAYAVVLIAMVATQLFSFEKFIPLLESFDLPGGLSGRVIAVTLVVSGVLALPFLLRMKLSMAMRYLSMAAGWVVALLWVFLTVWVNASGVLVDTMGLLGASVGLLPGWWAVFVAVGMGILSAWASWGLWPGKRKRHLEPKRKK